MKAVLYVKEKGKITNTEYQILCKLKKRQTTDDLKDLENKTYLYGLEALEKERIIF